ncbi:hypothetical protein WMY93_018746 [Mugilogobius chulae]|uniref:Uncharacterized protein n=1 Tax=Mugilogobius chulae TaxID=88201 RepID=A0AAW0NPN6_9GOBI
MASKNGEEHGCLRRIWSWLEVCCCVRRKERIFFAEKINGDSLELNLDGPGETDPAQTVLEEMGIVNRGFSLLEEEPLTRSASSVSQCLRYQQKKKLKPLSSLPTVLQPELAITFISGDDDEEFLFDDENRTPSINLIPPTPSDVVEDDQFFDVTLEDIVTEILDNDAQVDCQEEKKDAETKEGCIVTRNGENGDMIEKSVEEIWFRRWKT